jgi:hypothetical protein
MNSSCRIIYQQSDFPVLQNRVYDSEEEAKNCPTGSLKIVEDFKTGLVYNAAFRSELMIYDSNYNNEQSLSPRFRNHLQQVVEVIESALGNQNLIEIGCGKGFFLEMLLSRGIDISGFDPAYEGKNKRIVKKYFEPGIMKPANGLILRHVLEHIQNPVHFLGQLKSSNGGMGLVYIEVPCFDWICERRAWFDIFYEHVNYFRLSDFYRMFGKVVKAGHLFGGQYIYVIAELESLRTPVIDHEDRVSFPPNFLDFEKDILTEQLNCYYVIWGSASKGVIFSLLNSRRSRKIHFAIDINPAKQGKFLPVTAVQVCSPEQAMQLLPDNSAIYVMNSNYLNEIREFTRNKFNLIAVDCKS